jgi:FkbM family methyltransferase
MSSPAWEWLERPLATWIDVGAHRGEKSLPIARENPMVRVYAFEPNLKLAMQLAGRLPNFVVIPMAVGEQDATMDFYLNAFEAASSLLPFHPEGLSQCKGERDLRVVEKRPVPVIRLDSFMDAAGISDVDFLKVDAQGADLSVVRSAGERLKDIHRIEMEVRVTQVPVYAGSARKDEVLDFMERAEFDLVGCSKQNDGQEENLIFQRRNAPLRAPATSDPALTLTLPRGEQIPGAVELDQIMLACEQASIESGERVVVTTPPQPWAYAAAIPLHLPRQTGLCLIVRVSLKVLEGEIRVGVLAADERSFVIEKTVRAGSSALVEVDLPILLAGPVGNVIVRNGSGEVRSRAVLEDVSVWRAAS